MKLSRFFLLTLLLFFISFWWAGGDTLSDNTTAKIKETFTDHISLEEKNTTSTDEPSAFDRVYRIFALKSAVTQKLHTKNYAKLSSISPQLQQAIIAVEDTRFYEHSGFDISGILRASLVNLQYGHIEEGASTITQQLVKNLFLSQERSMTRKMEEVLLSIDMEANYSKEEILELYLNTIYFGSGYYGIHDAAAGYFGKMPSELTLAEASMLAGLPNAPSVYSPYVDFKAAKSRQAIVLGTMVKNGYINPSTAEETKRTSIWLVK
ncbi:transglycosylase domain-containing protein [Anaerosinus massiliensis]|uniref:transglycosylase domain-containing protein n=1 Tax=Massilibacillus massiliensis TaxID=1806837 RepID=UPI000B00026F|nr:biosynthetic peptidoglycan transglycosylase [Massilibacillus massiliensis]